MATHRRTPPPPSMSSLAHLLLDGDPEALVVRAGAQSLTRAELVRDATVVRDSLVTAGVGPGEAVAAVLPDRPAPLSAPVRAWPRPAVYPARNPRPPAGGEGPG